MLLDCVAASYLRKKLLLEMEAASRLGKRAKDAGGSLSAAEVPKPTSAVITLPLHWPILWKS
jgi:hypothetical protein